MENPLVFVAIARNNPTLIERLTRAITDCGCTIGESNVSILGDELCVQMIIGGSWDTIAKIETTLQRHEQDPGLEIITRRTKFPANQPQLLPYAIDVVGLDKQGIVHKIVRFMLDNQVVIQQLQSHCYTAGASSTRMYSLHMGIGIPPDLSIASVRGDFMDYCDQLNLDAIMEPVK